MPHPTRRRPPRPVLWRVRAAGALLTLAVVSTLAGPPFAAVADCDRSPGQPSASTIRVTLADDGEVDAIARTDTSVGVRCVGPADDEVLPVAVAILHTATDGATIEAGALTRQADPVTTTISVRDRTAADRRLTVTGPLGTDAVDARVGIPMLVRIDLHYPRTWTVEAPAGPGTATRADDAGTVVSVGSLLFAPLTDDEVVLQVTAQPGRGEPSVTVEATPVGSDPTLGLGTELIDRDTDAVVGALAALVADGTRELAAGARELADGSTLLADGTRDIATGTAELADGTWELADGTQQLAAGGGELAGGIAELAAGAGQLTGGLDATAEGAQQLAGGATDLAAGTGELAAALAALPDGARALADGADELATGLGAAAAGADELAAGGQQLVPAVEGLEAGAQELSQGLAGALGLVDAVVAALPPDAPVELTGALQQLAAALTGIQAGATSLAEGAAQLETGLASVAGGTGELAAGLGATSAGAAGLAQGTGELAAGLSAIDAGAAELAAGSDALAAGIAGLATGTGELADAGGMLTDGTRAAADGARALAAGTDDLADGTAALAEGTDDLAEGTAALAEGTDALVAGTDDLAEGSAQLPDAVGEVVDTADRAGQRVATTDALLAHGALLAADATGERGSVTTVLRSAGDDPLPWLPIAVGAGVAALLAALVAVWWRRTQVPAQHAQRGRR